LTATVVLLLALCFTGCGTSDRGVYLYNRTDVPLALGFAAAVEPCSERFLHESELGDTSRELAPGAWYPLVNWVILEDPVWMVVAADGTRNLFDPPPALPPCGGEPPDWGPA